MTPSAPSNFGYQLLVSDSFDSVLARNGSPTSTSTLLELAAERGRVMLQAPGGSGKTYTLERLAAQVTERSPDRHVIQLSLADTAPAFGALPPDAALLQATPNLEDLLETGRSILLLVDGLNEADRDFARAILQGVDALARQYPTLSVVVADRLTRRDIDARRWTLATLGAVPREEVERRLSQKVSDKEYEFLSSPAYLDKAIEQGIRGATRSESHREELRKCGLDDAQISRLASQALEDYKSHAARHFSLPRLREAAGKAAVDALIAAGVLVELRERHEARYRHHLMHDFLAAAEAATQPADWTADLFDALSFRRSSFDSLTFLLELSPAMHVDRLIRAVYDWDLYAAAYLLGEDAEAGRRVAPATEVAVLSLLGERKFDRFNITATQVADALRLNAAELAGEMLHAPTVEHVHAISAEQLPGDPAHAAWLDIFLPRVTNEALCEALAVSDGIAGWTASNVLHRTITEEDVDTLSKLTSHETEVVRWRASHALGGLAHPRAVEALFDRLRRDNSLSVQYGALRSLVEQASRADRGTRQAVIERLCEYVPTFRRSARLEKELARVLHIAEVVRPPTWLEDVAPIIEEFLIHADTLEEQDRWRDEAASLRVEAREVVSR